MQNARAAIDGHRCRLHLVGRGRGEDGAGAGGIEHPHAHETAVHRFVAAAAAGDDADLALDGGIGAHDIVRVEVHAHQVAVRQGHALQSFGDDIFRFVDQFLHGRTSDLPSDKVALRVDCAFCIADCVYSVGGLYNDLPA